MSPPVVQTWMEPISSPARDRMHCSDVPGVVPAPYWDQHGPVAAPAAGAGCVLQSAGPRLAEANPLLILSHPLTSPRRRR